MYNDFTLSTIAAEGGANGWYYRHKSFRFVLSVLTFSLEIFAKGIDRANLYHKVLKGWRR
jgi:hypothetical protein